MSSDTTRRDDQAPTRTSIRAAGVLPADTLLAGRYRIGGVLGVGGMGTVYAAHDERLDVDVAIKLLRTTDAPGADHLRRFESELRLARMVTHANVVRIHDIGEHEQHTFLTMDRIRGRALSDLLAEHGALEPDRAVRIAADVAAGLAAAHASGVVHRDLKPANILVDEDDRAVITDFGVARSVLAARMTRTGLFVGTPDYLAPEQARGDTVDARSDIYAMGVILFEMLTGALPFEAGSVDELIIQRTSGRLPDLDRLPATTPQWLRGIVVRCLQKNPQERFADAAALAEALQRRRAPARKRRVSRYAVIAAAALVLLLAAVALWRGMPATDQVTPLPASDGIATRAVHVAILPFRDEPSDPALAWLSTGIGETLSANLEASPGIVIVDKQRVRATLADLRIAPGPPTGLAAGQLAALLGTDWLVSGTLRFAGDDIVVQALLLPRGEHDQEQPLEPVSLPIAQLSGVGAALAVEIREVLSLPSPAQAPPVLSENFAALRQFALGVDLLEQGDTLGALGPLEGAVREDPGFSAAWLHLAEALAGLGRSEEASAAIDRAVAESGDDVVTAELARVRQAEITGDLGRARELLRSALERHPQDAQLQFMLAELYGDAGHYADAIEILDSLVDDDPNHPRAWFLLGKFSIQNGDSRSAVNRYLVRALNIQQRLGNDQGRADVYNALGVGQHRMGLLDEALDSYGNAAAIREQIGDQRGLASSLANLARVGLQLGQFTEAEAYLERAIAVRTELSDPSGLAGLYNMYGVLEEERGNYRNALQRYRQALKIRRDAGDRRALGNSYNNIGFAYFVLGEYDNAEAYWQLALEESLATDNPYAQLKTRQSIGQLKLAQGKWGEALELFLQTLDASRDAGYPDAEAVALGNLGRVAARQGRYGAALSSYDEALAILERTEDTRGQVEYMLWRAEALLELGADADAANYLDRVDALLAPAGSNEQRALAAALRATVLARSGQRDAARRLFDDALRAAGRTGSDVSALRALVAKAEQGMAADDDLANLVDSVTALGNADLAMRSLAVLAWSQHVGGQHGAALASSDTLLAMDEQFAPSARGWMAHTLAGALYAARGDSVAAQVHEAAAAAEHERLLADMPQDLRGGFRQLTRQYEELHYAE